jgi:hypothetical protein
MLPYQPWWYRPYDHWAGIGQTLQVTVTEHALCYANAMTLERDARYALADALAPEHHDLSLPLPLSCRSL